MSDLTVLTSRIWYRGEDRLDVTLATGGPAGAPFAPSRQLLDTYKEDRRKAILAHDIDAAKRAWERYKIGYVSGLEASMRRESMEPIRKLYERKRVVLVCYCPSPDLCHRGLLADYLSDFTGVTYAGEIEP